MPDSYPILLNLEGRLAVIVGGGGVALRKATGLLAAGAAVRCVAPMILSDMPNAVERVVELFEPRHLDGATLAFAATNSAETNNAVTLEAHRRGILVNRADLNDEAPGDFTLPAVWRNAAVTLAVGASGSPTLAAAIRDRLAERMDPALVRMAQTMVHLRPMIKARVPDQARRQEIFRALAGDEALAIHEHGGLEAVQQWIEGQLRRNDPNA